MSKLMKFVKGLGARNSDSRQNDGRQVVHLLHIGKTGGTAVKEVLKDYVDTPNHKLVLHGHKKNLRDVPQGDQFIFFLRDPVSRFISGFYSRQRKGQPRYYSEWNVHEKNVFEAFTTPNQMALALADKSSKEHAVAVKGMKNIQHFMPFNHWYCSLRYFQSRKKDLLFIGFQETLDSDFSQIKQLLNIPDSVTLPVDDVSAHKSPENVDKSIVEAGMTALKVWYADDYQFMALCREIMANRD